MRRIALSLATVGLLAAPTYPAFGQAWIGQVVGDMMAQQAAAEARHRCYMGDPMEASEVEEARAPTNAAMQAYFADMQSGNADASAHFALDKKTRWTSGDVKLTETTLTNVSDPLAIAGAVIDAEPQAYVRSGQHAFTLADWQVRDANGALLGTYTGVFVRKLGDYKLRTLTLTPASEYVEPVAQFCNEPGDVMPYRLSHTDRMKTYHEKRVAKAEAKLSKEQARLTKAEAKLADKPESSTRKAQVSKAQERVGKWETKLAERSQLLTDITREYEATRADEAQAKAEKDAAIAALAAAGPATSDASSE